MKKQLIAGLLLLSLGAAPASVLFAHSDGQACDYKDIKTLTKKLSLNKEQQAQVKTILAEPSAQKDGMTAEECKAMDGKIKAVLNDKQKAKFEKMCAERNESGAACCMPVPSSKPK